MAEIQADIDSAIDKAQRDRDPSTGADQLVRAELAAKSKLRELASDFQVKRPRGVALSADLSRRSVAYESVRSEVLSSVLESAERKIESALGEAGLALDATLHRRLRFDQAIDEAVSDARSLVGEVRQDLSKQSNDTSDRAKNAIRVAHRLLEDVAVGVLQEASKTDVSGISDEAFTLLRNSSKDASAASRRPRRKNLP